MKFALGFMAGFVVGAATAYYILIEMPKQTASGSGDRQTASIAPPADQKLFADAKELVTQKLSDPQSAQFQDLRLTARGEELFVCGLVNAKNRMGGYSGAKPFIVETKSTATFIVAGPEDAYLIGEYAIRPCFPDMLVPKNAVEVREASRFK